MITKINTSWHETKFCDHLGCRIGKNGAMTYIIDDQDRAISSKGYHNIQLKKAGLWGDDKYIGTTGSHSETVEIVEYNLTNRATKEPESLEEAVEMIEELREEIEFIKDFI